MATVYIIDGDADKINDALTSCLHFKVKSVKEINDLMALAQNNGYSIAVDFE